MVFSFTQIFIVWIVLAVYLTSSHVNSLCRPLSEGVRHSYKVFVYNISSTLLLNAEWARGNRTYHTCKKCIYEQFALEYVLWDHFQSSCARTYDPSEADFFYLPIIRDIDYRIALAKNGDRTPSAIETALLDAMERSDTSGWRRVFNVTDQYWKRLGGADHIIAMPAPVTNFRHQSNMRGFFHYMPQLHPPIFLSVELSRSFLREYPVCGSQKNIVLPYPTVDSDFYSGALFQKDFPMHLPHKKRDKLIFYHGGYHGSCERVRASLNTLVQNNPQLALQRGDRKREAGFQSAFFCPVPIGDSPSSKRMYDVMNFGCIPVILSDDVVFAFSRESGGPLDAALFSLQVPQLIVQRATALLFLASLTEKLVERPTKRKVAVSGGNMTAEQEEKLAALFNWGNKLLPASNTSLLSLIRRLAEEEREAARFSQSSSNASSTTTTNSTTTTRKLTVANKGPKRKSKEDKSKLKKGSGKVEDGVTTLLVRLLQTIPTEDIMSLQAAGRTAASKYRFYEMMSSGPVALRTDLPPMTANHSVPNGGAIAVLEMLLSERKGKGIQKIAESCQREKSVKHNYIGRYPCESRRRLLWT